MHTKMQYIDTICKWVCYGSFYFISSQFEC